MGTKGSPERVIFNAKALLFFRWLVGVCVTSLVGFHLYLWNHFQTRRDADEIVRRLDGDIQDLKDGVKELKDDVKDIRMILINRNVQAGRAVAKP